MHPRELRTVPLFERMTDAHLKELMSVFERRTLKRGAVLFDAGEVAEHFNLLTKGEISLLEDGKPRFRLLPLAPIGELGAVTRLPHNVSAVATAPAEVLRVPVSKLMKFFERHGEVAFPFYHNLLGIVSDKVKRDERRLDEMRINVIRTQKAMKRLRELVLSAFETPISEDIAKTLDDLIEHNRRWHYMVEPKRVLASSVRLDGGKLLPVTDISDHHLQVAGKLGRAKSAWSGVLVTPTREIPVSGTIERVDRGSTVIKLDMFVDEYRAALDDYLTRVQMLDFVV
jgi:CRP/FNR family cyclic AMP-dependent transcriptional regulator